MGSSENLSLGIGVPTIYSRRFAAFNEFMSHHVPESSPRPDTITNAYPAWSPRFWHGMRFGIWWRLLEWGRFRIHPTRWVMAFLISLVTPWNDVLAAFQWLLYGRKLRDAKLEHPPVFILGHWRSGTTLLHELLMKDPQYACPNSYQCFAPHHFLISEWAFRWFGGWMLPKKRQMDDMPVGWGRPQEDEFALMAMGLPSPYRRLAFCMEPCPDLEYLNFEELTEPQRQSWLSGLRTFMIRVAYRAEKPLVLKSPTHTGRLGALAKAFPGAKFIHITRDPRALFPSTMRLWRSLDDSQGLQRPRYSDEVLEEYVFECGRRMYEGFHAGRENVASDSIIDVRYEELVASPVDELRRIYQHLNLGDFSAIEAEHQAWAAEQHRQYRASRHQLTPEREARIRQEWSDYFVRYGYDRTQDGLS